MTKKDMTSMANEAGGKLQYSLQTKTGFIIAL